MLTSKFLMDPSLQRREKTSSELRVPQAHHGTRQRTGHQGTHHGPRILPHGGEVSPHPQGLHNGETVQSTVPVVLSLSLQNYVDLIQGEAFIHVDDFTLPKQLTNATPGQEQGNVPQVL